MKKNSQLNQGEDHLPTTSLSASNFKIYLESHELSPAKFSVTLLVWSKHIISILQVYFHTKAQILNDMATCQNHRKVQLFLTDLFALPPAVGMDILFSESDT